MKKLVITAARTSDGVPVYFDPQGTWSTRLNDAQTFDTEDEAAGALGTARTQEELVCDPALFKVKETDGKIQSMNTKSRLRLEGAERLLERLGYFDIPDTSIPAARVGT